jgi:hypothetical protein
VAHSSARAIEFGTDPRRAQAAMPFPPAAASNNMSTLARRKTVRVSRSYDETGSDAIPIVVLAARETVSEVRGHRTMIA